MFKKYCWIISLLLCSLYTQAQNDSIYISPVSEILRLPLFNKQGTEIVSASKKTESLFEAPLAASVVTREEIVASGATSIVEALRLVPGLMVRETNNGNYSVHIRGLDYVPAYAALIDANVTQTTNLVMIDYRPVYNHLNGGIFWDLLPIDVQDLERIEIVRGPASTLYGANAVSGVIHFITRQKNNYKDLDVNVSSQSGTLNTLLLNSVIGYRFNSKLNFQLSSHYQNRERENEYFDVIQNAYVPLDSLITDARIRELTSPSPETSLQKYGLNAYVNYQPAPRMAFDLSAGFSKNAAQRVSGGGRIPMEYNKGENAYLTLNSSIYNFKTYASYWWGKDGTFSLLAPYDYQVIDATAEYDYDLIKNLSITPSFSLRYVDYKEDLSTGKDQLLEEEAISLTYAGGIKIDYKPTRKWRIIAGLRAEKFQFPEEIYLNYQGAVTFKPSGKHFFRLLCGRANTGSFLYNNKVNISVVPPIAPPPGFTGFKITNRGVPNVQPITQDMAELGYRGKLGKNISWNAEIFISSTTNFTTSVSNGPQPNPPFLEEILTRTNMPLKVRQAGATINFDLVFARLKLTPFVTVQQTELKNFSPSNRSQTYDSTQSYLNTYDLTHEGTPAFYGGLNVLYVPITGLQVYLNTFFFGKHAFYGSVMAAPGAPIDLSTAPKAEVKAQALLNAKVSYKIKDQVKLFINIRNLFSGNNPQHFHTDRIRPIALFGFGIDL